MTNLTCSDDAIVSFGFGGRGAHLVIPALIAPILAFFLVVNRVYWRWNLLGRLGWDDHCTILSLVSAIFLYLCLYIRLLENQALMRQTGVPSGPVRSVNFCRKLWLWQAAEKYGHPSS